ncbi:MAG: hypothetical protein R8P61_27800 [Bacteroidia bacterium]|nr:hypothetical protein [Bacteroidia bacterium]
MKRLSYTILLFFLTCFMASAQTTGKMEDVIELKDGHVIYGWILEQEAGKHVKIELVGGSVLIIEQEKIESISRDPSRFLRVKRTYNYRQKPILYRERGAYMYLSSHFSFRDGSDRDRLDVGIHIRTGYRIDRLLGLGIGVGVDNYEGGTYMPIYLDLSGDLMRSRVTPHYHVSGGYAFAVNPNWPNSQIEGGLMAFAAIGYKIHTQGNLEWTVMGGYKFQQASERPNAFRGGVVPGESTFRNVEYQGLTLQFSVGF